MIKVYLRRLNITPKKVLIVSNLIRGLSAAEAERQLLFSPKRASEPLLKLLRSGLAAAKQKKIEKDNLKIKTLVVNEGPKRKRFRPASRSNVGTITKRTTHVFLELDKIKDES
ncbi:MAG: uL22 family ribosomal protein [Patescibacteria group bacterium]|nr:uL22 family ribosomal protein [Patescibacteria group bacterium]MCL5257932.1 uL22 family ribosomal protein [Patescibacteria group bacterium]